MLLRLDLPIFGMCVLNLMLCLFTACIYIYNIAQMFNGILGKLYASHRVQSCRRFQIFASTAEKARLLITDKS